jgi:PST family polysaccharide transporter
MIRMKAAALLLGPSGIGQIGLLQGLMATAAAIAAFGFGSAGTRQIASANECGGESVEATRMALFWGTIILSVAGGIALWTFRHHVAELVLGDSTQSSSVGWLAVGVSLTVAGGSQGALLNGLRRIGDLARVSVASAVLSTLLGVASIYVWAEGGIIAFVIASPLTIFLLGHWYVGRLPRASSGGVRLSKLLAEWRGLARLGSALMVVGVMWTVAHLAVRTLVKDELGSRSLGHFQAAWTIGTAYLGIVLGALGTDYYPRLAAAMDDHRHACRLVNEQTEVALLLAGPLLLMVLGLAPWLIVLLYSRDFLEGLQLLRWQMLSDVFKVLSWPLSYGILATGGARAHLLTESLAIVLFLGVTRTLLPKVGIVAAGISFVALFIVILPVLYLLLSRRLGLRWSMAVWCQAAILLVFVVGVFLAGSYSQALGAGVGVVASLSFGAYGMVRLAHAAEMGGCIGRFSVRSRHFMMKLGVWRD